MSNEIEKANNTGVWYGAVGNERNSKMTDFEFRAVLLMLLAETRKHNYF